MTRKKKVKRRKSGSPDLQQGKLIGRMSFANRTEPVLDRITRETTRLLQLNQKQPKSKNKAQRKRILKCCRNRNENRSSTTNADSSIEDENRKTVCSN